MVSECECFVCVRVFKPLFCVFPSYIAEYASVKRFATNINTTSSVYSIYATEQTRMHTHTFLMRCKGISCSTCVFRCRAHNTLDKNPSKLKSALCKKQRQGVALWRASVYVTRSRVLCKVQSARSSGTHAPRHTDETRPATASKINEGTRALRAQKQQQHQQHARRSRRLSDRSLFTFRDTISGF